MPDRSLPTTDPSNMAPPDTIARIIRRLIPFLCLLFIVNYLDRTNVAMAKLQMLGDAHLDEKIYGLGAGLFFIGYFIFEVPSNLILERIGARRWIARIMITWGIISACMMFVRGPASFYLLRFLLGAAEAGFFPGIVLYLTYWIPQSRRSHVMATFLTSTATSGIIGNPLAGVLMKMDGLAHLRGWQWLFLLEGILPVLLGVVTWFLLPDEPADAKWLSDSEKQWLQTQLADDHSGDHHHVADLRRALANFHLWRFAAIYFLIIMGLYGFVYWVPTIVKSVTPISSDVVIGLFAAIPYLVGAVTMVLIGEHADRHNERRWHIAACALIASIGVTATCFALSRDARSLVATLLLLCLAAIGIFGSLGPFWALATRFLRGASAAGGIAIVNSVGGLAGFVAPYAIGYIKQSTGGYTGLLLVSTSLFFGSLVVISVPKSIDVTPT